VISGEVHRPSRPGIHFYGNAVLLPERFDANRTVGKR
jgi:hypothetical protein